MSMAVNPSRPHGIPPSGQPLRNDSTPIHTAPAHTGPAGSDATARTPTLATATLTARAPARPSQAAQPIESSNHHNSTSMKARPKHSPEKAANLSGARATLAHSSAIATGASQPAPTGSKHSAATRPPPAAPTALTRPPRRPIGLHPPSSPLRLYRSPAGPVRVAARGAPVRPEGAGELEDMGP